MTKEELLKYKETKRELENIKYKIQELKEKKTSIKSQIINDMSSSANSERDRLGQLLVQIEELIDLYYEKQSELLEQQTNIEITIEKLDVPLHRNIMRLRYIDCHKWEKICVETNYSWEQIHRIHRKILKEIA